MGYQSIVYMASISGIDKSIYEAAAIDGANQNAADRQGNIADVKANSHYADVNVHR